MDPITAPIDTPQRAGSLVTIFVAAATHLFSGGIVARDTQGNAVPAADTAGLKVAGICQGDADNTLGAAGALSVQVAVGNFRVGNSLTDPVGVADIGKIAYIESDSTVCKAGGANQIQAGRIYDIDENGVWIDFNFAGAGTFVDSSASFTDPVSGKKYKLAIAGGEITAVEQ